MHTYTMMQSEIEIGSPMIAHVINVKCPTPLSFVQSLTMKDATKLVQMEYSDCEEVICVEVVRHYDGFVEVMFTFRWNEATVTFLQMDQGQTTYDSFFIQPAAVYNTEGV